jgi:D-alanyl-D-alanine carboxypeptidase
MTRTEAVVSKMNSVIARLAVCLTMLVAGCSAAAEAPGAAALKPLDPKAFQAAVDAAATELGVPGAMVLLRTPQGTVTAATGTTELGTQTPPSADTHFRIASNTKTMTSALIVLLAQDGKLKLSDPVSAYVPNVPNGQHITLAELLRLRSGLYGYTADPALAAVLDAEPGKAWTPAEALDIAFRHPPLFAPDAAYDYSNTNYVLLGLVAEKVGGRPLAEQLRTRLFEPLGLEQTSLPAADDTAMPSPYSHGYMYGGSIYALADIP